MNMMIKATGLAISALSVISPRATASLTFRLFCNPVVRSKVHVSEKSVIDMAKKDHVILEGKKVCVYLWGDMQRPVLLIHGWESRASRFTSIVKKLLDRGYSPVTFDMPGHGDSEGKNTTILECNEICKLLQSKFGDFEAVISHSFGVPCAFYAVKNSLRTQKIIAIAGLADFSYLLDRFSYMLRLNKKTQKDLKYRIEDMFHPVADIWDVFSVTYQSQEVQQPILVIHDTADDVVQISQAKKIIDAYGEQSDYHETSGYGHTRILHQNDVVQRIVQFIDPKCEGNNSASA